MDQKVAIEHLKKEATTNPTANAVFHMFATRKRARNVVTVDALSQRMKAEGFDYEKEDYVPILKLMASLGFGHIDTDKKGQVRALKDIKMTLQSIGQAAVGKQLNLAAAKQRNKFKELENRSGILTATAELIKPKPGSGAVAGYPVSITVVIHGKPVNFRVPKELNEAEIAEIVTRFRDGGGAS